MTAASATANACFPERLLPRTRPLFLFPERSARRSGAAAGAVQPGPLQSALESEESRRFTTPTGKRLARDAAEVLGERMVLCVRDEEELLAYTYVARGREARQRQRLAKVDQAAERERRVAMAHRQASACRISNPADLRQISNLTLAQEARSRRS